MTRRKTGAADDSRSAAAPIAGREVRIGSDLTIYTVAEWKETLLSELEGSPALAIDLSDVSELDTAGLQLLLFTGREAQRTGIDGQRLEELEVTDRYGMAIHLSTQAFPGE